MGLRHPYYRRLIAAAAAIVLGLALSTASVLAESTQLPQAPANLRLIPGDGSATLTWDRNAESEPAFIGYRVFRCSGSQGAYTELTPRRPDGELDLITKNRFRDEGLQNNGAYAYCVQAVNRDLLGGSTQGYIALVPPSEPAGTEPESEDTGPGLPGGGTAVPMLDEFAVLEVRTLQRSLIAAYQRRDLSGILACYGDGYRNRESSGKLDLHGYLEWYFQNYEVLQMQVLGERYSASASGNGIRQVISLRVTERDRDSGAIGSYDLREAVEWRRDGIAWRVVSTRDAQPGDLE